MEEKKVLKVNDQTYKELIGKKPLLLKLGAQWCGPCKSLEPVLENIRESYSTDILEVAEVDVDECPEICETYGVRNIPVLLFFNNLGELETRLVGTVQKKTIDDCIGLICSEKENIDAKQI